ncbi:MAG: amidohydrolase family protein [Sphingobium sp.]
MTGDAMALPRRALLAGMAGVGLGLSAGRGCAAAHSAGIEEAAIEPDLEIIDPHHHLFVYRTPGGDRPPYLPADFQRDIARSGHRVVQSVFVECSTMYRPDGPEDERSLGETDYVRGVAEASAEDGAAGGALCRIASAIVGRVDLRRGDRVRPLLERHAEMSGGRLRGIRNSIAWDAYPPLSFMGAAARDLLADPSFRQGFAALAPMDLSFDIWLFHTQIAALASFARDFPDTRIILNHLGCPLGVGPYAGQRDAVFANWKSAMNDLARSPNVLVKLGGLGPFLTGVDQGRRTSAALAMEWKPYIETAIALFGPERCMFESNWPANAPVASYGAQWNAFKRITVNYSASEKAALYRGTARRAYRLG